MSRENVEAVLSGMEAVQQEGGGAAQHLPLTADVEWDISDHPLPDFPDTGQGRRALVEHLNGYFSSWTDYESTVSDVFDTDDDVVVVLRERARVPGSDKVLERTLSLVWTLEGGRICRFRVFKTAAEARRAVGLED
jgi:ketosteroid isomerase-like protein